MPSQSGSQQENERGTQTQRPRGRIRGSEEQKIRKSDDQRIRVQKIRDQRIRGQRTTTPASHKRSSSRQHETGERERERNTDKDTGTERETERKPHRQASDLGTTGEAPPDEVHQSFRDTSDQNFRRRAHSSSTDESHERAQCGQEQATASSEAQKILNSMRRRRSWCFHRRKDTDSSSGSRGSRRSEGQIQHHR